MIKKSINIILIFVLILTVFNCHIVYAGQKKDREYTPSTADEVFSGAQDFLSKGENHVNATIDEDELAGTSDFIFNFVLAIAMVIAVAIGVVLGIKLMMGSAEENAETKQLLVPYVVACIVIFGSIGIWKLAIDVFDNL